MRSNESAQPKALRLFRLEFCGSINDSCDPIFEGVIALALCVTISYDCVRVSACV